MIFINFSKKFPLKTLHSNAENRINVPYEKTKKAHYLKPIFATHLIPYLPMFLLI